MKKGLRSYLLIILVTSTATVIAQCPAGQLEVQLDVNTDNYGYETYWEIVPVGNACGTGTIDWGGNTAVGCNGGGVQAQTPGGYGNNTLYNEGPWCLTEGADYDLISVDDWGDGHPTYDVIISGYPMYQFTDNGNEFTWTFTVAEPQDYDMSVTEIDLYSYINPGANTIEGTIENLGTQTITSFTLNYKIDGGSDVSENITGVNILPFTSYTFSHGTSYNATIGLHTVDVWATDLNGNLDQVPSNDAMNKPFECGDPIPNVVDTYLTATPTFTVISGPADQLDSPRDLAFHPVLTRKELWVVNKNTEASGGSTTTYSYAGETGQTSIWKRDGNAWHFMSLPTAIDFGENENFATAPGVFDANHNGGDPFTGPSLWDSDMSVYAEPSGGNGSHIDMLHCSPHAMGIAHEVDNVYWVVDGYNQDVVRYDFVEDHGPGNSDHGDAMIYRYSDNTISVDPTYHITSHCALDKTNNWLYVVDHGNDQVMRLDITSGSMGATPGWGPWETIADYKYVTGYTWETVVNSGLIEPAGIDVIGDRMVVSDHSTGDIHIYDISAMPATLLGTINTGTPGVMGLEIGPEGRIWYVNATTEEVVRIDAGTLSTEDHDLSNVNAEVYPNPTEGAFNVKLTGEFIGDVNARIFDALGKLVYSEAWQMLGMGIVKTIDVDMPQGMYHLQLEADGSSISKQIVITK